MSEAPSNTPKQVNTHVDSRWHFGIPILDTDLPKFESRREALIEKFLKMREAEEDDMVRSNQGGWHSLDNLHFSKDPDIRWLTGAILKIGSQCIEQLEGPDLQDEPGLSAMWVNINRPGDWNMPHSHLPNEWSGVVYIRTNDPENKRSSRDGDIIFMNPMPIGRQYRRPASISYTPADGKLFLFPGYLLHMVAPHTGPDDRISVAFNFKLQRQPPNIQQKTPE